MTELKRRPFDGGAALPLSIGPVGYLGRLLLFDHSSSPARIWSPAFWYASYSSATFRARSSGLKSHPLGSWGLERPRCPSAPSQGVPELAVFGAGGRSQPLPSPLVVDRVSL